MTELRLPDPYDVGETHAAEILEKLQALLWATPSGEPDPDKEWDSDTLAEVARILDPLRPRAPMHEVRRITYRVELMLLDPANATPPTPGKLGELLVHQNLAQQNGMPADKSYVLHVEVQSNSDMKPEEVKTALSRLGYPPTHFPPLETTDAEHG